MTGPELVERFITHTSSFGAELDKREAKTVDFSKRPYRVTVGDETVEAKTVIICTGSKNRMLGLESEARLLGRGVFVCATCDAALYEGLRVVVVGGGDSALQEALDITKFAAEVIIVHRGSEFSACNSLKALAEESPKIRFMMNTVVEEIVGQIYVEAVDLRDNVTGKGQRIETDGVLIAIGWDPNTALFKDQLELDPEGYIVVDGVKTSKPGIFVGGDLNDRVYRQVVTAAASGCMAALEAEGFLTRGG